MKIQIGTAGFFVDLAVSDPEKPGRFVLGIECDGAQYHSSRRLATGTACGKTSLKRTDGYYIDLVDRLVLATGRRDDKGGSGNRGRKGALERN